MLQTAPIQDSCSKKLQSAGSMKSCRKWRGRLHFRTLKAMLQCWPKDTQLQRGAFQATRGRSVQCSHMRFHAEVGTLKILPVPPKAHWARVGSTQSGRSSSLPGVLPGLAGPSSYPIRNKLFFFLWSGTFV